MSASADKQKNNLTCSSEDPSSHGIVVGIFSLMLGALCPSGAQWGLGSLVLVLWIPVRGRFILPLEVDGGIGRYFYTLSAVMKGHPLSW